MKPILIALSVAALLIPAALRAQTDTPLDPELGGRLTLATEKKLAKGLHAGLEAEARMNDNWSSLGRLQTTIDLHYKPLKQLKTGLGYSLIAPYSSSKSAFKSVRHRLFAEAQGSYPIGNWTFSLKERLQFTFRTGDYNTYQNPSPAITLKSRLKAKYTGLRRLTPYASVEMRTFLNAPVIAAATDGSAWYTLDGDDEGDAGWFLSGWNGVRNNRYRLTLGADYRVSRSSTVGAYLMADYADDLVVDANAAGTRLKSYTREHGFIGWLGIEYCYKW